MQGLLDGIKGPAEKLQLKRADRQLKWMTKAQLKSMLKDKETFNIVPLRKKIYGELMRRISLGIQ